MVSTDNSVTDILVIDADYDEIDAAIEKIFAAFPLEVKGKKVLLKPNMVGGYEASRAVTTHPSVVRGCLAYLKNAGAEVTVGDNPGVMGYGMNEKVARDCGILEVAGEAYRNISREVDQVPLKSSVADSAIVSRAVLEADVFITLPRFKTHLQTLISGAIKNSYGILAGGEKARFHRLAPDPKEFSRLVTEVYAVRPPDLAIMDAGLVMEGDGPSSKDLRSYGKIIAARNSVALDTLMVAIMGLTPADVPMLGAAGEMGLGETDLAKLKIEGEWSPIPDFKLPRSFGRQGRSAKLINKIWGALFSRPTLRIVPSLCQRCGVCFRQCPAQAVEKTDSGFRIDRSRCIHCYCCHELCVYDAVEIGSPVERILKKVLRTREGI